MLSGFSVYSQTRADVTVKQSLTPGIYKLELKTKDDGILTTSLEVAPNADGPQLASTSTPSINNGYTSFTMSLVGTGFTSSSRVMIDNATTISSSHALQRTRANPCARIPQLRYSTSSRST